MIVSAIADMVFGESGSFAISWGVYPEQRPRTRNANAIFGNEQIGRKTGKERNRSEHP